MPCQQLTYERILFLLFISFKIDSLKTWRRGVADVHWCKRSGELASEQMTRRLGTAATPDRFRMGFRRPLPFETRLRFHDTRLKQVALASVSDLLNHQARAADSNDKAEGHLFDVGGSMWRRRGSRWTSGCPAAARTGPVSGWPTSGTSANLVTMAEPKGREQWHPKQNSKGVLHLLRILRTEDHPFASASQNWHRGCSWLYLHQRRCLIYRW